MIIDEEVYLEHFGVKGMHWGIRHDPKKSNVDHSKRNKRIAIVLGSVAAAGAIAAGALYLKKRQHIKLSNIGKPSEVVTNFAKSLADEPVDIVHSSRGRDRGYMFLQRGGLKDPHDEFIKGGLEFAKDGFFNRYDGGKIAARFVDPEGRKDFSGRPIGHDVILPKGMAGDHIQNADQVRDLVWPKIKHLYNAAYHSKPGALGPGF